MAQIAQYYNVLRQKLQPSIDIQAMGSTNIAIRRSTTFGPQLRPGTYQSYLHQQQPSLLDAFKKMNT